MAVIGEMRHRIEIHTITKVADAFGKSQTETDTLTATVWAQMTPSGGGEAKEAGKPTATNTVIFRIRKMTLTEKQKIKYGLIWYNITRIDDGKRYLDVTAEKKV